MGYPWQAALAAVFVEGLIFIVLSVFNVREAIFNSIPMNLKKAVSVGIGILYRIYRPAECQDRQLAVQRWYSCSHVEDCSTLKGGGNDAMMQESVVLLASDWRIYYSYSGAQRTSKGNILWGILITWLLGIICQFTGLYVPNAEIGYLQSSAGLLRNGLSIPSLAPIFMKLDFDSHLRLLEFLVVIIFAFLFVDIFDTLGNLDRCGHQGRHAG